MAIAKTALLPGAFRQNKMVQPRTVLLAATSMQLALLLPLAWADIGLLDDYPLTPGSAVTFGGTAAAGVETVFQEGASNLTLTLGDDSWRDGGHLAAPRSTLEGRFTDSWVEAIGQDSAASSALLAALVSLQSEATGWNAAILAHLNYTHLLRLSGATVVVQLPRFQCYDLISPEVLTLRVPAVAVATGRAALAAAPLRIAPTLGVTPPRWGSVWAPPREESRNCTHVTLVWRPPAHDGGTPLAH